MSKEFVQPYSGPSTIDLTGLAALLVDLAPGAMRGMRREQPGMDGVAAELAVSVPALGAKAAISPDVYANFKDTHGLLQQIRAARALVVKAAEVLEESEVYYEDQREGDISLIVAAVRTAARHKDASIQASFEKTLAYNAQIALKAAKTRQKKKADRDAQAEPGAEADAPETGTGPSAEASAGAP